MRSSIYAVVTKETRELLRDPTYIGLAIGVPLAIMLLLGLGFSMDVKNLPIMFYDQDRSSLSREYIYSYTNSEYFRLVGFAGDSDEIDHRLHAGEVRAVVVIPPDFSRKLRGGEPVSVQAVVDGSFPSRAEVVRGYMAAIDAQFNEKILSDYLVSRGQAATSIFPISVEGIVWYNPSLESKNSIVPGVMVITLMFYPALIAALVVVREKEIGTILNLYCSPVRRWQVVIGKAVPYVGVAFVDYLLIFALSILFFRVRFIGSFPLLTVAAAFYVACTIGVGILISVLCRTQIAAILITFLTTMVPAFMFSGLVTPVSSEEPAAQVVSYLIPATHFMGMVRGIYLKGLGFDYYAQDLAVLALYALLIYALAIIFFRKKVG
jgi:ABC-2 type transport system permease protein